MAEYEPDDSRIVTNTQNRAPGEPPRTGPREDEARARARQPEQENAHRGQPGDGAIEGDSPRHPDRFGGVATSDEAHAQVEQAESRSRDDDEDYVPEGK